MDLMDNDHTGHSELQCTSTSQPLGDSVHLEMKSLGSMKAEINPSVWFNTKIRYSYVYISIFYHVSQWN